MRRVVSRSVITACMLSVAMTITSCGDDSGGDTETEAAGSTEDTQSPDDQHDSVDVTAEIVDAEGNAVGEVEFRDKDSGTEISASMHDLPAGGYHGFHIHEIGECEPDSADPEEPGETGDFLSAGGHLNTNDSNHPDHDGDLPSLRVLDNGEATLVTVTDRFTTDDLLADDGAAVMVHSEPDNFANIPERYAPSGPDEDTLGTGDAGDRLACGVVESG